VSGRTPIDALPFETNDEARSLPAGRPPAVLWAMSGARAPRSALIVPSPPCPLTGSVSNQTAPLPAYYSSGHNDLASALCFSQPQQRAKLELRAGVRTPSPS
jgi:hypothetical protein